jgi:glucose/arabinose dehydrogenase
MTSKVRHSFTTLLALALVATACGGNDPGAATTTAASDGAPVVSSTTVGTGGTATPTTGTDGETTTTEVPGPLGPLLGLELELLADGLRQPTVIASPPGDDRLFIGERGGIIQIYDPAIGAILDEPFMFIPDRVTANGIEQGLLGLAFHPDYSENGRFFIYHNDRDAKRQLAEYAVLPDDPNKADLDSGVVLFDREQPKDSSDIRHYGGMLMFGPDGYLYIASGDGAAGRVTGQSTDDYFGAILRIDVDSGDPFGIPPDNPYIDGGGAPPVWAIGLRNPWRFTIDGELMYIADVGQAAIEEIDVIGLDEPGANFGWATMEGSNCFSPSDCDRTGLVLPIHEIARPDSCSITGGHVYRGNLIPELDGHYFFADWCFGWVRSLLYKDGAVEDVQDWSADLPEAGSVNSFGIGSDGEIYLVNHEGGFYAIRAVR